MSTAITKLEQSMPVRSMSDAAQLAQAFAQAHVMGVRNDPEGMLVVAMIREIGLIKAEATYHLMHGRISKKASAVMSDFMKLGGTYKITQRDAEGASMVASYGENKDVAFSFMWEDAIQEPFVYSGGEDKQFAQLALPFDQRELRAKYRTPRSRSQMLWARLVSDMCTAICPEARDGMYTPEEVADFTPERDADKDPQPKKTINVTEAAERMAAGETQINYTLNPIAGKHQGKPWDEFTIEQLTRALDSDNEAITHTHKAAIRLAISNKEG